MKTYIICCPELPERNAAAVKHFNARGLEPESIWAIHGETFGLLPSRPYNVDRPGCGFLNPISQVGLMLSHYMTWQVCIQSGLDGDEFEHDYFLILEDDAKFPEDWKERLDEAMGDLPPEWDIFLIGNSNTEDKEKRHICGDVWEVKYPFTTHAYLVRRKALRTLLANCRDATLKIDILLIQKGYPLLNVYTMLPRLVDQRGTELQP
jgi:GR25 family glycosyltransferase involved in LPS biosynthesis